VQCDLTHRRSHAPELEVVVTLINVFLPCFTKLRPSIFNKLQNIILTITLFYRNYTIGCGGCSMHAIYSG
jgi:hypothetical protein